MNCVRRSIPPVTLFKTIWKEGLIAPAPIRERLESWQAASVEGLARLEYP
jgi:hypothetical protein